MIKHFIIITFRNLLQNKVYSTLIIGGFGIGFAACILIGLFYFTEKNVNTAFDNHKQIYRLYDAKKNGCNLDYNLNPLLSTNYPEIEKTCPMEYFPEAGFRLIDAETNTSTFADNIISTNNKFFEIFSVDIIESVSTLPFEEKESFVITESVAKKLYRNGNALGKTLTLENFYISFKGKITAIIKDLPDNSSFKAEIIINSDFEKFRLSMTCDNGKCINLSNHFIQLNKGVNVNSFASRLNNTLNLRQYKIEKIGLQPLDDIYLTQLTMKDMHAKGNLKLLKIFLAIAILILLLSSINYLNYTISMQYAKLKTIGINKTNGAGWKQLVYYSFTEVFIGIFISVTLSILLAIFLLPYSEILFGKALSVQNIPIVQLLTVFVIGIIVVILLNSLAPVYLISRFNITDFLSKNQTRKGKHLGKQTLLVFQLTVSIVLISAVIGVFKQLYYVKHSDLGFDKEHLVKIDIPNSFKNPNALKQEIAKLPFVSKSTFSNGCPGKINMRMGSNTGENSFTINCITIGDNYLETMGIKLIEGRTFLPGDINNVCLLNESAVKQYEFENIKGKRFNNGKEGGYEIIGITKDFHISSFYNAIEPVSLIYNPNVASGILSIKLMPGNVDNYMDQIKQVWKKMMPYELMNFTFYDEQFQAMYSKEERMAKSITFFSFIAIILTCMGILGQIFLVSLTRTKEIGIRKVNGARVIEILAMLNKDFIKWVTIAFIISCPIAWYTIHTWLQNFAYKIELSWWVFAAAGAIALVIALLTVSWQSWRAATRNPVESLRYE